MKERKDTRIHISLTKTEKERMDLYCKELNINRSRLLRFWINEKQPLHPVTDELEGKLDELIRIGVELKMMAGMAEQQRIIREKDKDKLLRTGEEIRRLRHEILKVLSEPVRFRAEEAKEGDQTNGNIEDMEDRASRASQKSGPLHNG